MAIVAGFDVHRAQITFDALDDETGELKRGRIGATPEAVREWAGRFARRGDPCRGRGLHGLAVRLRGAAGGGRQCRISRSRSRRARCGARSGAPRPTARTRAGCARCSARAGCRRPGSRRRTCASGAPARGCARRSSTSARTWLQRVQATLFHHGVAGAPDKLLSAQGREFLAALELPDAASERIAVALSMIEALDRQLAPLEQSLRQLARRQTGCRALMAPLRDRRADRPDDPLRARRRDAPVGLAQGGALRRPRHRRAPLRPPLAGRQADQTGLAAAALGALRVSPSGLQTHKPRPRRLPGAQGARALAHQGVTDDRPQTRPPLLPHAARARPRRPRTRHLTLARSVPPSPPFPDDNQSSGRLPQLSRLPPTGGGPPKTERPESFPADRPIDHHVADPTGRAPR